MKEKIALGQIDLSFHKVTAGYFHRLLLKMGYEVELITAPHEHLFAMQEEGKVDLLISAWLPGSHGKYLAKYEDRVLKFATLYEPYCVWCVPNYIPQSMLGTISDLNNSGLLAHMEKEINGIGMGAGISRFSVEMIDKYGLSENGYFFKSNDFNVFTSIVEENINKKKWFIAPLWFPQYLHRMFSLRVLNEPMGLLRGVDKATPVLLKSSVDKFRAEDLERLSKVTLGNEVVTEMDYLYCKEGYAALEIAEQFSRRCL